MQFAVRISAFADATFSSVEARSKRRLSKRIGRSVVAAPRRCPFCRDCGPMMLVDGYDGGVSGAPIG